MKLVIKFFSISVFLVCILPMFQTCSDSSILKWQLPDETIVDSTIDKEVLKKMNDSLKRENKSWKNTRLTELRKEYTVNAYELGVSGYREFEVRYLKDWTFYFALCFTISIIISLIVSIKAIKENFVQVFKLSFFNLVVLISAMLIFIFKFGLEIIEQIRYGYYVLILNILVLILLSKIQINRNSG